MGFSTIERYGDSADYDAVPDEAIRRLLASLDDDPGDAEHGDVWLTEDETGWSIGVFAGDRGLVVLENVELDDQTFHRTGVPRAEAFRLLRRAADGEMAAIRRETWTPGYGS